MWGCLVVGDIGLWFFFGGSKFPDHNNSLAFSLSSACAAPHLNHYSPNTTPHHTTSSPSTLLVSFFSCRAGIDLWTCCPCKTKVMALLAGSSSSRLLASKVSQAASWPGAPSLSVCRTTAHATRSSAAKTDTPSLSSTRCFLLLPPIHFNNRCSCTAESADAQQLSRRPTSLM